MLAFIAFLAFATTWPSWKNGEQIPAAFPARAFGASGPLYQRLPPKPRIDANSGKIISYYFAGNRAEFEAGRVDADKRQAGYDYNFPVYTASSDDPLVTIFCDHRSPAVCADDGVRIHMPAFARQAGGEDRHLAVLEPDGTEYDFWLVSSEPPYRDGSRLSATGEGSYALDGTKRDANSLAAGFDVGSATAGGVGLSVGQIYTSELAAGRIDHAIALVFPCGTRAWVFPASQTTGICAHGQGMPLGSRVWWRPDDEQTDGMLTAPRDVKTILKALHRYGGFFIDNGNGTENIDGTGGGMGMHSENQEPYWIYGRGKDPALAYAAGNPDWIHVKTSSVDRYLLVVSGSSVDFLRNLKVLAPCVTQRRC